MFLYFLKNPRKTGALCSSSKKLGEAMVRGVGLENASHIAEIGPGLGVFTAEILRHKSPQASFFALEINPNLAKKLQAKMPDVEVINQSAGEILQILQQKQIQEGLDVIVSGLPWSVFSGKMQDELLQCIHQALKEGGYFTTFAYSLPTPQAKSFRKKLFKHFKEVKISKTIWHNFPPARVYYCQK